MAIVNLKQRARVIEICGFEYFDETA